jgi:superfamily I DNA and RNA helicase
MRVVMINSKKPDSTEVDALIEILNCVYHQLPSDIRGRIIVCIQNKIKDEDSLTSNKGNLIKEIASKIINPNTLDC